MPRDDVLEKNDVGGRTVLRIAYGSLIGHDANPQTGHKILGRFARDERIDICIRRLNDPFVKLPQLDAIAMAQNDLTAHVLFVLVKFSHLVHERIRQARGIAVV